MSESHSKIIILFVLLFFFTGHSIIGSGQNAQATGKAEIAFKRPTGKTLEQPKSEWTDELLQFTAGGHVLGFRKGEMFIASGSHALKVEFVNARSVSPVEEGKPPESAKDRLDVPPLGRVTYRDLWDGVSVVYEKTASGVVESTYLIQSGGAKASNPVDEIRLRYNVPVKVNDNGNLVLSFATGEMQETRPMAWQEVAGKKVAVEAGYQLLGAREVGFDVGAYDPRYPLVIDPLLSWNTFLGGPGDDASRPIAVDTSGNVYVMGHSSGTWGSPVRAYTSSADAFVAKLDGNGVLQWNTFLGGTDMDIGRGIAVDTNGNLYVTGYGTTTWGSPIRAYTPAGYDAFVAKLDGNGALQWNTFLGGSGGDYGTGITVDTNGNVYVTGVSNAIWGSPVRAYTVGNYDAIVAKLDGTGNLQWSTFLGGSGDDEGYGIAVDTSGNVCVTTWSNATWGSPVRAYTGDYDAIVAKLNNSGVLQWNTFLGGTGRDEGLGIAADTNGNVYAMGTSYATWGSPLRAFGGGVRDGFVAELGGSGNLQWNAFLGGTGDDIGYGIAVDTGGNIYMTGFSTATWGSPVRAFSGSWDAFVAKISYWDLWTWTPKHAVGDFYGDGKREVAVDFGAKGIYLYNNGSWTQISSLNPESLLAADADGDNIDEIVGDMGATGLWLWNSGAWNQLSGAHVENLAVGDVDADGADEIVGDFGPVGLWLYNGGVWTQLSGVNADYVTTANLDGTGGDEIIGAFGATGLWIWNAGTWTQLSGVNADYVTSGKMTGGGRFLVGDFGPRGLWLWWAVGGWTELSGVNADYMITADTDADSNDEIVGDFGATGLWRYNSGVWTILSGVDADFMIRADVDGDGTDEVVADFGMLGLWLWNAGAWTQASGVNPEYHVAAELDGDNKDEILADFGGLGLWLWNEGSWSQISANNAD